MMRTTSAIMLALAVARVGAYDGPPVLEPPPLPPVDCEWDDWGEWSDCSQDCNMGVRVRYREKTTFERLGGTCVETVDDCSQASLIREMGGTCTSRDVEACNGGSQVTGWDDTKTNDPAAPYPPCTADDDSCTGYRPCPVDCVWGFWGEWSECSAQCGQNGVQKRERTVLVDPWPSKFYEESTEYTCETNILHGDDGHEEDADRRAYYPCGRPCEGSNLEYRPCFRKECPVDCEWSEWSSWSTCSKNGDGGRQIRTRYVKVQEQHGGKTCKEDRCDWSANGLCGTTETRPCNTMSYEVYDAQRIRPDSQDGQLAHDLAFAESMCVSMEEGSIACPMNLTRTGGPLTAVAANHRPNDPITENCIDGGDCDSVDFESPQGVVNQDITY